MKDTGHGEKQYVNHNPWELDPNDPDQDQLDVNWGTIRGYCIERRFHKTAEMTEVWLWLSQPDMVLLKAYEVLVNRYLKLLKIETNLSTPLFINKKGSAPN